jgi:hypothetical protein
MPHDVKPVKDHFPVSVRNIVAAGVDGGRPYVQADRLNLFAALLGEGVEVGGQARFLAVLADVLDRELVQVADERHVAMPLGNRLLINADLFRNVITLGGTPAKNRSFFLVLGFVPGDAQGALCLHDVRCQKYINSRSSNSFVSRLPVYAHGSVT